MLRFEYSNFRGVRFAYKGVPLIILMLNEVTNMDDLSHLEDFSSDRVYEKNGKQVKDEIGCRILGVRAVRITMKKATLKMSGSG